MSKIVIANWKAHPATDSEAMALAEAYSHMDIPANVSAVVCPPSNYLNAIRGKTGKFALGAQNFPAENVEYVILGHSDRRAEGETDELIRGKVEQAIAAGLKVVLCVGEQLPVREQGLDTAKQFVLEQLEKDFVPGVFAIAYEPIWSISTSGTGLIDIPEKSAEMISTIKAQYGSAHVLYGGSVNAETAIGFLKRPEIEGVLVGKASLNGEEFQKIITAANK